MFLPAFLVVPEGRLLLECQDHPEDQGHLLYHHLRVFQAPLLSLGVLALQDYRESLVLLDSLLGLQVHLVPSRQEIPAVLVCLARP